MSKEQQDVHEMYELGYHLIPTLPEDEIARRAQELRSIIEKAGGEIKNEESPRSRRLAYTMRKKEAAVYHKYDSAYFGWMIFESSADAISNIKSEVEANSAVLRYLILKDPNIERIAYQTGEDEKEEVVSVVVEDPIETPDSETVSNEEVDKSIEKITE